METTLVLTRQAIEIKAKTTELHLWALSHSKIETQRDYDYGVALIQEVKQAYKFLDEERTKQTAPLNQQIRDINDLYKPTLATLEQAETTVKKAVTTWKQIEQAKRDAEQKRLEAEQEQKRRAQQAELARIAEEARKNGSEEAARNAEIKAAELEKKNSEATVLAAPTFARNRAESTRKIWKAEVQDLKALAAACVAGTADLALIQANDKLLGSMARGSQGGMTIPGVRFYYEESLAVKS
jgi:hypothetical protein